MNSLPLVSICIPACNCEKYIGETLQCFCIQTYPNIELIVVNDGSTDGTAAVVKSITDTRIKLINAINGGAAKARNIAYGHANGEYIIFFDADDFVKPDFIYSQVNKINGQKDIVVLSAWGRFYDDDISTFKPDELPVNDMLFTDWIKQYWYNCNPMTNPGRAIIPTDVIKKAGPWNETLSLNDDLDFFTRIFLNVEKIVFNHDALFYYRSGIKGLSAATGDDAYLSLYNSILLSVNNVLNKYNHEPLLLKSCANMWQSFIYLVYPQQKKYVVLAQNQIKRLTKPDLKFQASGITRYMVYFLGWKITKKIKFSLAKGN